MTQPIESLERELQSLQSVFPGLTKRLEESVARFRSSGAALPEAVLSEVAEFKRSVAVLAVKVKDAGNALSPSDVPAFDANEATLDVLEQSLRQLKKIEENSALRERAVGVLNDVELVARRDRTEFAALLKCQATARALREAIEKMPLSEQHPAAAVLADGTHPLAILLRVIDAQNDLNDEEWLRLSNVLAQSLGRDLALAATRSKLELVRVPQPAQVTQAAAASLQSAAVGSAAAGSEADAGFVHEINLDIDEFVANHAVTAQRTSGGSNEHIKSSVQARTETVAGSEQAQQPSRPAGVQRAAATAQIDSGERSVLVEVEDTILEIIRLEETAEMHLAKEKLPEAVSAYKELLALQQKVFGLQNPRVTATTEKLAAVQRRLAPPPVVAAAAPAAPIIQAAAYSPSFASVPDLRFPIRKEFPAKRPLLFAGVGSIAAVALGIAIFALSQFDRKPAVEHVAQQVGSADTAIASSAAQSLPPNPALDRVDQRRPAEDDPSLPFMNETSSAKERTTVAPRAVQRAEEITAKQPAIRPEMFKAAKTADAAPPIQQAAPAVARPAARQADVPGPGPMVNIPAGTGAPGAALAGLMNAPAPPPPAPAQLQRIRVGGAPTAARLIKQVSPAYPPLARSARLQGKVQLEGVIGTDGMVHDIKVLSGHPMLRNEAINAVKQWRYEPSKLNGVPTEVTTTMDVRFSLE